MMHEANLEREVEAQEDCLPAARSLHLGIPGGPQHSSVFLPHSGDVGVTVGWHKSRAGGVCQVL